MSQHIPVPFRLIPPGLAAAALVAAFLLGNVAYALPLPPAGTDTVNVTGQVSITSRSGQETIALSGTATIQRAAPHSKGSVDAIDAEITSLSLAGTSVTGPVTVTKSASPASIGEIRAMSGSSFPATSFFNVYADITIPASPAPTITLHTNGALVFTDPLLFAWPPYNATYAVTPSPCMLLQPSIQNPAQVCITSAAFAITAPGVGGLTELPAPAEESERASDADGGDDALGIAVVLALLATFGVVANHARSRLRSRR